MKAAKVCNKIYNTGARITYGYAKYIIGLLMMLNNFLLFFTLILIKSLKDKINHFVGNGYNSIEPYNL